MLKFYVKVFYVMGKALSGELSCPCDRSCLIQCYYSTLALQLSSFVQACAVCLSADLKVNEYTSMIFCHSFINPIALRKAKIPYNFGFSECSRVIKGYNFCD